MHWAWKMQSCIKIVDIEQQGEILKGLSSIMYDKSGPSGNDATFWAIQKLQILENKYPRQVEFWNYVKLQWLVKVHMWIVGFKNLPHAGEDTNVAIESYHSYMKYVLKAKRSLIIGCRVDWCIHALTGDICIHYWYQ